jgi:dynactin 1
MSGAGDRFGVFLKRPAGQFLNMKRTSSNPKLVENEVGDVTSKTENPDGNEPCSFAIGDVVHVTGTKKYGVVRFMGTVDFSTGIWVGLELPDASGKNDGSVQGRKYFSCKSRHGLFVRANICEKSDDIEESSLPESPRGSFYKSNILKSVESDNDNKTFFKKNSMHKLTERSPSVSSMEGDREKDFERPLRTVTGRKGSDRPASTSIQPKQPIDLGVDSGEQYVSVLARASKYESLRNPKNPLSPPGKSAKPTATSQPPQTSSIPSMSASNLMVETSASLASSLRSNDPHSSDEDVPKRRPDGTRERKKISVESIVSQVLSSPTFSQGLQKMFEDSQKKIEPRKDDNETMNMKDVISKQEGLIKSLNDRISAMEEQIGGICDGIIEIKSAVDSVSVLTPTTSNTNTSPFHRVDDERPSDHGELNI